ncbi:MAG: site-specific integrase [Fusobacteriaceae bacterium]|jgi:integrase/recombinase XerD|nr:site-specific integrase [Fusobacteriaceae bacterium]
MDHIWAFLEYARNIGNINDQTFRIYEKDINDLRLWLKEKEIDVEKAKTEDLNAYLQHLQNKYKTKTVYRKTSSIRSFYKYLLEQNVIPQIPLGNFRFEAAATIGGNALSAGEYETLLAQFPDTEEGQREKILTEFIYESGLKNTEVFSLQMRDLRRYEYRNFLLLKRGKLIKRDISPILREELMRFAACYPEADLFDKRTAKVYNRHLLEYGYKAGFADNITSNVIRNSKLRHDRSGEEGDGDFFRKLKEFYLSTKIGDDLR